MSVNKVNSDGSLLRVAGGTLYVDLPIGSWVKNDSNTLPSGFLKAGDTISQILYPELYAMYGSTVPYKADTSELSDYEDITFPASLRVTAQYDGVIITTAYDGGYLTFNINGNRVYIRTQSSGINAGTATVPIRKGDVISVEGADGSYAIKVRYYKKSLIVKAKQVAVPFDVAEYIRNQNVLSDYETASSSFTAEYDGFISATVTGTGAGVNIQINGVTIANNSNADYGINGVSVLFKKGDVVNTNASSPKVCYYKLRDYSGR